MNKKELYLWAKKGYSLFRYFPPSEAAVEKMLQEGVMKFGFQSDGGQAFKNRFPDVNAFDSYSALKGLYDELDDIEFIGNAILSKWESLGNNKFAEWVTNIVNYSRWFLLMFHRILTLTNEYNEFIYCDVVFENSDVKYTYISDDKNVCEGDIVLVPVGPEYEENLATVKSVKQYFAAETPIAPIKVKHIIRKAEKQTG